MLLINVLKGKIMMGENNLLDYDDILNKQRNIVYYDRRQLLESQSLRETVLAYCEQVIKDIINLLKNPKLNKNGL